MKTLVFGSSGFFGQYFMEASSNAVGASADIADPAGVARELDSHQPEVVINCAGKTGRPNVDWCEQHREETLRSNVTGPLVLLDACLARDLYLVHLSSGCLYQGDNGGDGFRETDAPNFMGSFYSRSKAYSDRILAEFPVLQLRPRMPFDETMQGRSLFGKLVRYRRVLDAPNSFTFVPDFIAVSLQLIADRRTGTFNVVNPGASSPYEMMLRYRELVDPSHQIERMTIEQLHKVTTARRSNCILSIEKLGAYGTGLRPVNEAIDTALRAIAGTGAERDE